MRVPVNWLKEYVGIDASAGDLAEKLTFSGLEVEGIEMFGPDLGAVVVVEVLDIKPHPGADNLLLCRVHDGRREYRVVCGARNFGPGSKVAFAPAGVTLPGGARVEKAEIRGELSDGMLCAEDELGISDDHGGLLVLEPGVARGTALSAVVGPPEPVLVIEVTPNRPDCLGMIGIARETAAVYGAKLKLPDISLRESGEPVEKFAAVEVRDSEWCPRYTARVLRGVKIGPSPLWMRLRLLQGGVRPISNVVDITNYVLLECGQPLHAFDRRLLEGGRVIVRRAKQGEVMSTLDGVKRTLTAEMLVIADAGRAVAVAGVMGGLGSEIQPDTSEVLLESACFKASCIRRTSKTLGLSSESSYRFERGVDINLADWGSRRAAALMAAHAGASVARGAIDIYPAKPAERLVRCRFDRVRSLSGLSISNERMTGILESLELPVAESSRDACTVRVPSFRGDLDIEADLIEEIARIHGLDQVPARAPRGTIVAGASDAPARAVETARSALAALGLTEIVNYSFVSARLLDMFDPADAASRIVLPNPVNADQSVLRTSLVPQMVHTLGQNLAHQVQEAAFFEAGRVYFKDEAGKLREEERVAVGLMGAAGREGLEKRLKLEPAAQFLRLKGIVEALSAKLRGPRVKLETASLPWAEAGAAATLLDAADPAAGRLGAIGLVKASIRDEWRMAVPVAVLEIRLAPLLAGIFGVSAVKPLPQYPCVVRDIAMVVDRAVRHESIMEVIRKNAPPELTAAELFDIYTSEALGAGRKSVAYSLTYRASARTLTDEEANQLHAAIKAAIVKELNAEVRER